MLTGLPFVYETRDARSRFPLRPLPFSQGAPGRKVVAQECPPLHYAQFEAEEASREAELRAASLDLADEMPTDDKSWEFFNHLRIQLIEKELHGPLTSLERTILGTLERLADRRIQQQTESSRQIAEELLARLQARG